MRDSLFRAGTCIRSHESRRISTACRAGLVATPSLTQFARGNGHGSQAALQETAGVPGPRARPASRAFDGASIWVPNYMSGTVTRM